MKKLRIIVPYGSALDSYLADAGFIYDEITRLSDKTYFKMNITSYFQLIEFLVSKFRLTDYSIRCDDGVVTFLVRP